MKIVDFILNDVQYIKEVTKKDTIIFHHTAGNKDALAVAKDWNTDKRGKVATAYIIGYDGTVVRCFDDKYWGYALGIGNAQVEKKSIQIELCAWGYLTEKEGKFYNYVNREIPESEVETLETPFKGFKHFHRYSNEQIQALKELVTYLCEKHSIKGSLSLSDFQLSNYALKGGKGFFTHNSYRLDKSDVYPDKRILEAFKKGWSKYST